MRTALTELLGVQHPIVGFNRSPGVVAAVTNAGGFGVLGASGYTAEELDAQLTWIEDQVDGKPYGIDLLVPGKFAAGDPDNLVASLRAQIPAEHLAFVSDLLARYGIPESPPLRGEVDEITASLNPAGAVALLDAVFSHRISLIANALGTPPPDLVTRAKRPASWWPRSSARPATPSGSWTPGWTCSSRRAPRRAAIPGRSPPWS